ncbi:MAG: hypothetical protein DRO67_05505, partial [Candidatus Asgardarchaeum californiense]
MNKGNLLRNGLVFWIVALFFLTSFVQIVDADIFRRGTMRNVDDIEINCDDNWTITEVVSTESTSTSTEASLAIGSDGTVHVAWTDYTNYNGSGGYPDELNVFYKSKLKGRNWATTELLSIKNRFIACTPSIAVGPDGRVHAVWVEIPYVGGEYSLIYKSKPIGGKWGERELITTETNDPGAHSLAVDGDGAVHIVWQDTTDYGGAGPDMDIFYKQKPAKGNWTATELVSTESTNNSYWPSLAIGPNKSIHVAWFDDPGYGGFGNDRNILYKSKPYGGSWGSTELVSTESTGVSYRPSLAVGTDGVVHIAWCDGTDYSGSGPDPDIFYKKKLPLGYWTNTEVISTESSNESHRPSLAVDNDQTVHVAWYDRTDYGGAGPDVDIFYKMKKNHGNWTDTEIVSTETTSDAWYPSLAVDDGGTVHLVWEEYTSYGGSGNDRDIFYKYKPSDTVIIDNDNSAFNILSGTWYGQSHTNAYNGTVEVTRSGNGSKKAAWRVHDVVDSGVYDVYIWKFEHDHMNLMATNAHYIVRDRNGFSNWITVDQSTPGNEWVPLGSYEFDGGYYQGVLINDDANGYVIAD